jgi:hypothetical protein
VVVHVRIIVDSARTLPLLLDRSIFDTGLSLKSFNFLHSNSPVCLNPTSTSSQAHERFKIFPNNPATLLFGILFVCIITLGTEIHAGTTHATQEAVPVLCITFPHCGVPSLAKPMIAPLLAQIFPVPVSIFPNILVRYCLNAPPVISPVGHV